MSEPGMKFGAEQTWWNKPPKKRPHPHEGIDIRFESGECLPIRPIENGTVVAMFDDFLGRTAVVERQCARSSLAQQFWVYAHMELDSFVRIGACVEGTSIGRAALSTKACPSHVHISLLEASCDVDWSQVGWKTIHHVHGLRFLHVDLNSSTERVAASSGSGSEAGWHQTAQRRVNWIIGAALMLLIALLCSHMSSSRLRLLSSLPLLWSTSFAAMTSSWSPAQFHDIPLFESAAIPPLPSGSTLSLLTSNDRDDAMPLGSEVWPAAAALCRWQLTADVRSRLRGSRVLELGSGTGAVGLFAAGMGANRVVLTDRDELLPLLVTNVGRNGGALGRSAQGVEVAALDWRSGGADLNASLAALGGPFDVVLGSDLTYPQEASSYDGLANVLAALLAPGGGAAAATDRPLVLLAHEHRSSARRAAIGKVGGRAHLGRWDEHDGALASFTASAARHGLRLSLIIAEEPVGQIKGEFRRWTADVSIIEVSRLKL